MPNKMNNRALEPIECQACQKMIEIGQVIVKHHVTYFPEKIVKVHASCHGLIHKSNRYPHLTPDPRQSLRWNKKKKIWTSIWDIYAFDWNFLNFMHSVDVGFLTPERREEIRFEMLQKYWRDNIPVRKNFITLDWEPIP